MAEIVYRLLERGGAGAGPGLIVWFVKWKGCEGRHKSSTYWDLMGLAGRGLVRHLRSGTRHQYRHPVDEA
ncbi:MAG: hypothetical protein OXO50_18470, partial [Caldilineaceae bacterium]|nr:hypothetical protein [Caldilineaceae bacterium]